MIAFRVRSSLIALTLGSLLLLPSACKLSRWFSLDDPVELTWRAASLTLAWDPPVADVPHSPVKTESYQIFYRPEGYSYWQFLDEIPASEHPEYRVHHEKIGNGSFVFAVRAVTSEGRFSPLHSSLDNDADPISGWYVNWIY